MPTNEIDLLMDEIERITDIPSDVRSPSDIDKLIEYHRKNREAGPRPKRDAGPLQKIDLVALGLISTPKPPTPGKGMRRL